MTSLADTVATLREAVTQLQAALAPHEDFARVAHFTASEAVILSAILRWDVASFEQINQALYAGRSTDWPGGNGVGVLVHRIRRKLASHGVDIVSAYGVGFCMTPDSKSKLRSLMAGVAV